MPVNLLKMPNIDETDSVRFWSKVEVTADIDKCWNWLHGKSENGYGRFKVDGRYYNSNRIAYFITKREDPGKLYCAHTCDNPSCCNPNHIFLATNQENMQDCVRKKRYNVPVGENHWTQKEPDKIKRGEGCGASKLKDEQVIAIRDMQKTGNYSNTKISKVFNITRQTVDKIINKKTWIHI